MSDDDATPGPYQGDGETVYATDPEAAGEVRSESADEDGPKYRNREWLYTQYHVLKRSQKEIAEECGVCQWTIYNWMDKLDIETRDRAKASSLAQGGDERLWDEGWLREQYVERERSCHDIADQLGVDHKTVYRALDHHDIDTRTKSAAWEIRRRRDFGGRVYNNPAWLRREYVRLGKSIQQIADGIDWSEAAVFEALHRHDIPVRSNKAANLSRYKNEKCKPNGGSEPPEPVTGDGIDAAWTSDLADVDDGCYIPYRDPTWLREQVGVGLTDREIAETCDVEVSKTTIRNWRHRFGIERDDA